MLTSVLTLLTLFQSSWSFSYVNPSFHYRISDVTSLSPSSQRFVNLSKSMRLSMQMTDIDAEMIKEISSARIAFWLCFFGAGGSAAVGRAAIPKTYKSYELNQSLKGKDSLGGESLGLFGYPETVYSDDVMMILNNPMSVDEIVETYPIEGKLPGLLQYESFVKANPDANPMAVRAVFDSLVIGINKMSAVPAVATENIENFKLDLNELRTQNNISKAIGITALAFLLALIGGADWFAFYHCWRGWFPLWPGLSDLPGSLFAKDIGLLSIPNYWMSDLPEIPLQ